MELMKTDLQDVDGSYLGFPLLNTETDIYKGFLMELMVTFYLVLAIFAGALNKNCGHKEIAVLVFVAITMGIMLTGPITGGGLNPCRVFGPDLIAGKLTHRGSLIYYVGPMIGGGLAGLLGIAFLGENNNKVD